MKKLLTAIAIVMGGAGCLVVSTQSHAQSTDPKMEWAVRMVALQQGPELDRLVEQLANTTTGELLQNWRPRVLASVPKSRQERVTEELNTELKKYFDDVSRTIAGQVSKVSSEALVPAYMERFSLEELKQIAAFFESPAIKKYQAAAPQLGSTFIKQLVDATRADVTARAGQFDATAARIIGATPGTKAAPVAPGSTDKSKPVAKK